MTAVLFLCGIVFVIYTYGGPESINTGDLLSISSVFAAFVSHLSKFNHFIPTPASADKHISIPYPYRFHGGTGQYGSAFSPVQNSVSHGQCGRNAAVPVLIDHSLQVHKFRIKRKVKRSV